MTELSHDGSLWLQELRILGLKSADEESKQADNRKICQRGTQCPEMHFETKLVGGWATAGN